MTDQRGGHTFVGQALGSPLRLQLTDLDAPSAADAWAAVTSTFQAVDHAMSGYRADSEVSALNAVAGTDAWLPTSAYLYDALALCCRAWRLTDGRFDPRVFESLRRLGQPGVPDLAFHAAADADTVRQWLRRDPRRRSVALDRPVDLHGIGKGLALRWAARRLAAHVPEQGCGYLLEAGGDLIARGPGPGDGAWLLGIEDPRGGDEPVAVVAVTDGALCTSSTRRATWLDPAGRPVHHLIDPSTREPGGDGLRAVTVALSDPAWAEVWTKALFLAGPRNIGAQARSRGLAAWWILEDGTLEMTPAGRQRLHW